MFGGTTIVESSTGLVSIPVASTGVVYTKAFPLFMGEFFGVWLKATSPGGTPDVKLELEQSYLLPTTEGSAETTLWVIPDSMSAIAAQINDELAHIFSVSPKPMPYGRYKITGINANPADTVVQLINFMQERTL